MSRRKPRNKASAAQPQTPPQPFAQYDAAGQGRRMRGWRAPSTGPNRAMAGAETIRNRTRDAVRNDWSGAAAERSWTVNLIGSGIIPRPKTGNARLKARLIALWDAWCPDADADGVLDFYGLQTLAVRSWIASGEAFVRLRPRRLEDGLEVPLQLQVLESDQVPMLDADRWPGMPEGHRMRSGIELDRIGRRAAIWFYREHPGDTPRGGPVFNDLVRVPAEFVVHMYEPRRPGQLRGVSEFAAILARLRSVMDFDDATLERQKLVNLFAAFIIRPPSNGPGPLDMLTGQPVAGESMPPVIMEPGIVQELAPGEDVRFSEPPGAGTDYTAFMRGQHLGVSAGAGIPYELLTGDLKDVSDRVLRIILNEFHRHCEQRQWQIIIHQLCRRVRNAWASAAVLSGAIATRDEKAARDVTWSPQAWAYLHPVQDVQAKRIEVEAGFKSRSQIISAAGDDPDEVDQLRAQDLTRERRGARTGSAPGEGD